MQSVLGGILFTETLVQSVLALYTSAKCPGTFYTSAKCPGGGGGHFALLYRILDRSYVPLRSVK